MLRSEKKTVRLGRVSVRQAEAVKVRIEQIASSLVTGIVDSEAGAWLAGLDDGSTTASRGRAAQVRARAKRANLLGAQTPVDAA